MMFFRTHVLKDVDLTDLAEGELVQLAVEEEKKGPQATWVRRVES